MRDNLTRRDFIGRALSIGAVGVVGTFAVACGKKKDGPADPCGDESGLSASEKTVRKSSSYVVKSPHQKKTCNNCTHWLEPDAGKPCGSCKIVKGPISSPGYCNLWVKKA